VIASESTSPPCELPPASGHVTTRSLAIQRAAPGLTTQAAADESSQPLATPSAGTASPRSSSAYALSLSVVRHPWAARAGCWAPIPRRSRRG